jgi:isopropylmalate/homocitrate/citramalate synthase
MSYIKRSRTELCARILSLCDTVGRLMKGNYYLFNNGICGNVVMSLLGVCV